MSRYIILIITCLFIIFAGVNKVDSSINNNVLNKPNDVETSDTDNKVEDSSNEELGQANHVNEEQDIVSSESDNNDKEDVKEENNEEEPLPPEIDTDTNYDVENNHDVEDDSKENLEEDTKAPTSEVFRYPEGKFSERTLDALNKMGYKSYFWSFAYKDWEEDHSKSVAFNWYSNYYHNGAIYLIHPRNKGNYEALEDFIDFMIDKGYSFTTVDTIK